MTSHHSVPRPVLSPLPTHQVEALIEPQSSSDPNRSRRQRRVMSQRLEPTEPRRRSSRSPSPGSRQRFRLPPPYQTSNNPSAPQPRTKNPGGDRATRSACPKCLGRNPHRVLECNSPLLWNGAKCYVSRTAEGRLVDPRGEVLCTDWQHPNGCSLTHRAAKHNCSGCGQDSHGAQECDLAQALASSLTI